MIHAKGEFMNFIESVRTCLFSSKYLTFKGRASRSEYWWFQLFTFAVGIIFGFLPDDFELLDNIVSLLMFIPTLAVASRRLHDWNRSAWWMLLPGLNFAAGMILIGISEVIHEVESEALPLLSILGCLFCIFGFISSIVLYAHRPRPGTNGFGNNPLDPPAICTIKNV